MQQPAWLSYRGLTSTNALFLLTLTLGCLFHFLRLDSLPMGFYVDESSIGYNAHLIALSGVDEHGVRWPLYFQAFGEYKNPLYIYLLAGFYRVFGYSLWATRALSGCCWLVGSLCLFELARRLFVDSRTRLYVALCLAFTPWLFSLTRVSYEFVILYPLLAAHLLALYRGFEEGSPRWALVAGVAIGLCLYAYTAFRLLALLYAVAVLLCYRSRQYRKVQVPFIFGAGICAIPFAIYAFDHFSNLTARFKQTTYLRDPTLSVLQKAWLFIEHYASYFGPSFLALFGDPNRRHHTGFGGEFLLTTVILLVMSVVALARDRSSRFKIYLLVGVLLTPVAAALTTQFYNSVRTYSMIAFVVMLSAYELRSLSPSVARGVVALTAFCAALYVGQYFYFYPPYSAVAFENYDFKGTLNEALNRSPTRIVLSSTGNQPYINLLFFGSLFGTRVPLQIGTSDDLRPGDIYIDYDPKHGTNGLYWIATDTTKALSQR